jgi:hypothetical protein
VLHCDECGLGFLLIFFPCTITICRAVGDPAFLETEPMKRVLDIMKGSEFHEAVATLPGYIAADTGSVSTVREFLERMDAVR